jgi:hypothetical protein
MNSIQKYFLSSFFFVFSRFRIELPLYINNCRLFRVKIFITYHLQYHLKTRSLELRRVLRSTLIIFSTSTTLAQVDVQEQTLSLRREHLSL